MPCVFTIGWSKQTDLHGVERRVARFHVYLHFRKRVFSRFRLCGDCLGRNKSAQSSYFVILHFPRFFQHICSSNWIKRLKKPHFAKKVTISNRNLNFCNSNLQILIAPNFISKILHFRFLNKDDRSTYLAALNSKKITVCPSTPCVVRDRDWMPCAGRHKTKGAVSCKIARLSVFRPQKGKWSA